MSCTQRVWTVRFLILLGLLMLVAGMVLGQDLDPAVKQQISDILAAKDNFTAAQQKIDSNLVFAAMAARGDASVQSFSGAISPGGVDNAGNVTVDIQGASSPALTGAIAGGRDGS